MFNLIVAVISIALIAAMAAASIFYGGSAFSSGTAQAAATTLINNGQQISGAQQLYMIDNSGNREGTIGNLTPDYLQAIPTPPSMAGGAWAIVDGGNVAAIDLEDAQATTVCEEVEGNGGQASQATAFADADDLGDHQYGCFNTAGSDWTFAYKL